MPLLIERREIENLASFAGALRNDLRKAVDIHKSRFADKTVYMLMEACLFAEETYNNVLDILAEMDKERNPADYLAPIERKQNV
jgi:uncharacterized protein HemY